MSDDGGGEPRLAALLASLTLNGTQLDFAPDDASGAWTAPVAIDDRQTSLYVSAERSSASYENPYIVSGIVLAGEGSGRAWGRPNPETLLSVNELNADAGTKYRLIENASGSWSLVCERDLEEPLATKASLEFAFTRLIDADAMTSQIIVAITEPEVTQEPPPPPRTPRADSGHPLALCRVLVILVLAGFVAMAVHFSSHPDGVRTGPGSPDLASKAPAGDIQVVALSHGFTQNKFRGVLDEATPGGPTWMVYQFDPNGKVAKAIAVDPKSYKLVVSYKRLETSGAFRYLPVAMTNDGWVYEGSLLALAVLLVPSWARRTWQRTLVLLWGGSGRLTAWLGRCFWGVCWLGVELTALVLVRRAGEVRSPANEAAAAYFVIATLVVWTFAGVAVMRHGADEVEAVASV